MKFNLTIFSSIFNEERALKSVKIAILYSDRVKVYLPGLFFPLQISSFSPNATISVNTSDDAEFIKYYNLMNKIYKAKEENIYCKEYERKLYKKWECMVKEKSYKGSHAGYLDLFPLAERGLIILRDYAFENEKIESLMDLFYDFRKSISENRYYKYFNTMAKEVSSSNFLLFDDYTGSLFNYLLNKNVPKMILSFEDEDKEKIKNTHLMIEIMNKLPLFTNANLGEILDIKKELEKSITRFKSKIVEFSEEIKNLPWDRHFDYEVNKIFIRYIEPEVLNIEEKCKSNTYLNELINENIDSSFGIPLASSFFGFLVSELSNFPSIHHLISAGVGATLGEGMIALKAYKKWREKFNTIKKNKLYFYYSISKYRIK